MRPSETRRPTTPLKRAGMRTEPPMSLPWAIGPIPVATAAPAPPLDPPAESAGSRGFSVRPCNALSAKMRIEKAGVLVRPMITAPARLRLATTGLSAAAILSRKATTPLSVGQPAWSVLTFIVTGTPCSAPRISPRACASSAVSAVASASSSSSTRTTALIAGLTAWRRERQDCAASRLEPRPPRINRASSVASSRQRSSLIASRPAGALDCPPHPLRGRRHVDVPDPVFPERVDERVHHRRQRAGAAGLAAALGAQHIGLGRHRVEGVGEERRVRGPRQRVIHVGAGQQLAFPVVDHVLAEGLADPLDDAAMRLAVDQQRIDHG